MKKVVHLITGIELGGGAENMLLHLLPDMQRSFDNRVFVLRGRGEIGSMLEKQGVPVYYLEYQGGIKDLWRLIQKYKYLLHEVKPDVQVNYLIHADIFGRIFGRIFRIPVVVSYIRNIHKQKPWLLFLDACTLPLAKYVIFNSFASLEFYQRYLLISRKKASVIPNGVKTDDQVSPFDTKVLRSTIGLAPDSKIIICNARLEKQKNIPVLLEAFSSLVRRVSNVELLLIGHGSQKVNLQERAKQLGVDKKVIFLEKRKDVPQLLSIADVFVLPSLHEGMSNALLEAMNAAKMIIVSDIPENTELISDQETGLVFRKNDSKHLAELMESCLTNTRGLSDLGKHAQQRVRMQYGLSSVKDQFVSFLQKL